jgi:hypothetical protein
MAIEAGLRNDDADLPAVHAARLPRGDGAAAKKLA